MASRSLVSAATILILAAASGCSAEQHEVHEPDGPVAEAHVFSGRENPAWPVHRSTQAVIADCVETASETDTKTEPTPMQALGFRGIVVRGVTIDGDENATVRAHPHGTTLSANGEHYTVLTCDELYPALRESAIVHLPPDELDLIP